jgi:hypothetical protein
MAGERKVKPPTSLEALFLRFGHVRKHAWPEMNGTEIDYMRYCKAMKRVERFCYWKPWGWLPWSGLLMRFAYRGKP